MRRLLRHRSWKVGGVAVTVDPSSLRRPRLVWDWLGDYRVCVGVFWGDGDPVWSVDTVVTVPGWIAVWLP